MARRLSWKPKNMYRRQRREDTPDIPPPLKGRDLSGFRLEYWYATYDGVRAGRYYRNRSAAVRDAKARKLVSRDVVRMRVITSDGRRGWLIDTTGDRAYVRTHRTLSAERESRVACRVRKAQATGAAAA